MPLINTYIITINVFWFEVILKKRKIHTQILFESVASFDLCDLEVLPASFFQNYFK